MVEECASIMKNDVWNVVPQPKEKRMKLEPVVEKGIFVGYSVVSKAYQIYIPLLRKVVARQDVKFEEDRAFRRSHGSDAEDKEQEAPKAEVTPTPVPARGQFSHDKEEQQQQ